MPYKIDPNNKKCVVKADTGKKVGCTKGSVKKYLTALRMHVHESDDLEWAQDVVDTTSIDITNDKSKILSLEKGDVITITGEYEGLSFDNEKATIIELSGESPLLKFDNFIDDGVDNSHCGEAGQHDICECQSNGVVGKCWYTNLTEMENVIWHLYEKGKTLNESEDDLAWAEDTVNTNPTYRFRDLVFKPHRLPDAVQARLNFPNGHYISVVGGPHMYGDGVDTFEIWGSDTSEPEGYLTKADVTNRMFELQNLPPLEGEGSFKIGPITESEENDLEWAQDAINGFDEYKEYDSEMELSRDTFLIFTGRWDQMKFDNQEAKVVRKGYSDTYLLVFPEVLDQPTGGTHCGDDAQDEYDCHCEDNDSERGRCWFVDLNEMRDVKIFPNRKGFINENKKPLLTEGRYDAITRKAVKDIMQVVTETRGKNDDLHQAVLPWDIHNVEEYEQEGLSFYVELNVHHQPLLDRGAMDESEAYYVNSAASDDDENVIMMTIVVDPLWEPKIYEKLFYKLQEDIRHEIEHFTQSGYNRIEDRPISTTNTANLKTVFGHHKHKLEVPALVHGFYRRAKLEKRPLDEVMIEDLDSEIQKGNLTKKQAETLLKMWVEYAKKNLPRALYSKE